MREPDRAGAVDQNVDDLVSRRFGGQL